MRAVLHYLCGVIQMVMRSMIELEKAGMVCIATEQFEKLSMIEQYSKTLMYVNLYSDIDGERSVLRVFSGNLKEF